MDKDKLKRKYLADTLRVMATKIENGFPLDEEQEKMLVKLSREIVILHPNELFLMDGKEMKMKSLIVDFIEELHCQNMMQS